MPNDDHAQPPARDDAVDAGIRDLLAGPCPVNRIHGAIELDGSRAAPRARASCPSRRRAATSSRRCGAWIGSYERSTTTIVDFTTAVAVRPGLSPSSSAASRDISATIR